jgi:hypothetical protein
VDQGRERPLVAVRGEPAQQPAVGELRGLRLGQPAEAVRNGFRPSGGCALILVGSATSGRELPHRPRTALVFSTIGAGRGSVSGGRGGVTGGYLGWQLGRRMRSYIPASIARPSAKPPSGRHRRRMRQRLNKRFGGYGQRWQAESGFSMFKRRLDAAVYARTYWTQCEELLLKAITYNVMLISVFIAFLRSSCVLIPSSFFSYLGLILLLRLLEKLLIPLYCSL